MNTWHTFQIMLIKLLDHMQSDGVTTKLIFIHKGEGTLLCCGKRVYLIQINRDPWCMLHALSDDRLDNTIIIIVHTTASLCNYISVWYSMQ